jgi:hypothetical protein
MTVIRGPPVCIIRDPLSWSQWALCIENLYTQSHLKGKRCTASRWMWFPPDQRGMRSHLRAACVTLTALPLGQRWPTHGHVYDPEPRDIHFEVNIPTFHYTVVTGSCLSVVFYR